MYSESGGAGDVSLFAGGGFMQSQSTTGNKFSSSVTGASRVRFAAAYCFRGLSSLIVHACASLIFLADEPYGALS